MSKIPLIHGKTHKRTICGIVKQIHRRYKGKIIDYTHIYLDPSELLFLPIDIPSIKVGDQIVIEEDGRREFFWYNKNYSIWTSVTEEDFSKGKHDPLSTYRYNIKELRSFNWKPF